MTNFWGEGDSTGPRYEGVIGLMVVLVEALVRMASYFGVQSSVTELRGRGNGMVWRVAGMVTMLLAGAPGMAGAATGLTGDWQTKEGSVVRVFDCRDSVCAKVVRIEPGAPGRTDAKNPKAELRSRPVCGLEIGSGFVRKDPGHATDGSVYDPKSGRMYHGTMDVEGDELRLRGYVGVSLFGRTETWRRIPVVEACRA